MTPTHLSQDAYPNVTAPRTSSFNRDTSKDPAKHWLMMSRPRHMSDDTVNKVDEVFRNRYKCGVGFCKNISLATH